MMDTAATLSVKESAADSSLIVVGAAVGMGRWLVDHLFASVVWRDVTLVDVEARRTELGEAAGSFARWRPTTTVVSSDLRKYLASASSVSAPRALIVVSVPLSEIKDVAREISSIDLSKSTIVVVSERLVPAIEAVANQVGTAHVVGVHPLFERATLSIDGQIVYVVPPDSNGTTHVQVTDLIRSAGGVVNVGTAYKHDKIMKYVQAAAHQTLLNFMDVLTRSGLSLESDLWAARTPLFETLFGLATRVLEPRQRKSIVSIQGTAEAKEVAAELLRSAEATRASISATGVTSRRLDELGEQLSGSLFSTARHVAQVAVTATQATRTELSRRRARQELVALRLDRRPDILHVGHLIDVGPIDVTLEDVYLRGSGRGAVLATGPGLANQTRVGAQGSPRIVVLNIGQVSLLAGSELERELDRRLAYISRDVRFLVPESVSGAGVLRTIMGVAATRGHSVVSEVVRTGQRAVLIHVEIRADQDPDAMVESLRSIVQRVYEWPAGICRPAKPIVSRIMFLGPYGTFSENAARQCADASGAWRAELVAVDSFDDALADLNEDTMAVLPISSSASGLVSRSFDALWNSRGDLITAGIVDVSVRLDAYVSPRTNLKELQDAPLYSHPQALAQCGRFIRRWKLRPVACKSTAEALSLVEHSVIPSVALAAAGLDIESRNLRVGEREVDDLAGSITRFLIVGRAAAFEDFSKEFAPTMRSIFLGKATSADFSLSVNGPSYEERLMDDRGNFLFVSSQTDVPPPAAMRKLGTAPWSPRTPIVRVAL